MNWTRRWLLSTGTQVNNLRIEAVANDLIVDNRCFIELGHNPTTLDVGLMKEVLEITTRYAERCGCIL